MKGKKVGIQENNSSHLNLGIQVENPSLGISNEWNDLIINANPDLIFSIDRNGRFTSANDTLCKAMHISHADILGKTSAEIGFSKEICDEWEELDKEVYKTNAAVESITSAPRPDGVIYFYKVILHPLHDVGGSIIGIGGIVRDITDYKDIKDELKKSQREFYTVVQNAPDIIGIHCEGKVVFINKKGIELLKGNTKEDILGKQIFEFVHDDFRHLVMNRVEAIIKDQTPLGSLEEKFVCLDGSFIDVEVRTIPIRFLKKESVLIIARDISGRKKAEEALRMERSLFRTVIDNIPDSIYVKDTEGRKIIANPQELKYMGVNSETEAIGKTDFDIYPAEQAVSFDRDDQLVLKKGKTVLNKVELIFDQQKQRNWLLSSKVPLRNEQNEIIGLVGIGHNITERQKMIEQLNESKERLDKIIQSSSDWVWEVDAQGKYTYCSDKVERILGYTADEIIGKTPFDLMPENESKKMGEIFSEIVHKKELIVDLENWNVHKNGQLVCMLTNGYPVFDNEGNLKGYIGVDKDITIRKNAEKVLNEYIEKLRILIELIPYIIIFKDGNGRWMIINEKARKRYGFTDSEWLGKTDLQMARERSDYAKLHMDMNYQDEKAWEKRATYIFDTVGTHKNGIGYTHEITKVPLFETNGDRKGILVIVNDITQRKKEESHLKLLETVILNATDAIVITEVQATDITGPRIVFVNEAYLKMTGYSREEILGNTPRILQGINTDKNELKKMHQAIVENQPCEIEVINYKKNGEEFWTSIAISPVLDDKGKAVYWVGIKRDITESKKQEQNVKKAILSAQENEKYFIGRELHDNVAQLLIGSLLSLGMVKALTEKDTNWLKDTNDTIHTAIDEIRRLSHHLAPASFKGNSFSVAVEDFLNSNPIKSKFKINKRIDKLDKVNLSSDIQLNMYRILQEHFQNIIKHSKATIVDITIRLSGNMLRMRITDNGNGFDTSAPTKGIGLQNIITRVEMFSGLCSIRSSEGNGCELIVKLPFS